MLKIEDSCLLVIDIQEKLTQIIPNSDQIIGNTNKLISACHLLNVPILLTEQYPKGLGGTDKRLSGLDDVTPIEKLAFSVTGEENFINALEKTGRKNIIIAGIETHICVYQSAFDLFESGYIVHIVKDAVGSRNPENHQTAIDSFLQNSLRVTCVEMALFELTKTSKHPSFKQISKIIK